MADLDGAWDFTPCSSASIVNFEHAIAGWDTFTQILSEHIQHPMICCLADAIMLF